MRRELVDRCLMLINTKYIAKNKELPMAAVQMWEGMLSGLDDEPGCAALGAVLMDSPFVPDWADVREKYAEMLGVAPDETPDEAVARKRREAAATEAARLDHERYVEDCRRQYGPVMADPVLRAEWFRNRLGGPADLSNLPDLSNVMAGIMASHTEEPKS